MGINSHALKLFMRSWPGRGLLLGAVLIFSVFVWDFVTGRPLAPWSFSTLPNLSATGDLPSLSDAMERDAALRTRVQALTEKDEGWLFVNYKEVDKEIAAILLMWAGADMTKGGRTAEGLDQRIDIFLRKVHGLGPDDYIMGDPLIGDRPWVRWFTHFKPRLLIQMAAMRVYDGAVVYDPLRDKMGIDARLSPAFMKGFAAFAAQQPDPTPYINNLLAFIDSTLGLKNLSEGDDKRIKALIALRK